MRRSRIVRIRATVALATLLACALACGPGAPAPAEPARLSILAVGDTGVRPEELDRYRRQLEIGSAMAAADRGRPAQAFVLLGDNFYDVGLRSFELTERLRANLVRPYCYFLALTGPRSHEVSDSCALARERRRPLPFYALLGNHDYMTEESPALQRETIPLFVSNWRMPPGATQVVELGHGVSLVLFDSDPVFMGGDAAPLSAALRSARGPWRVLTCHHPIAIVDTTERESYASYRRKIRDALVAADVPVQLLLAAHEHNLQLLTMDAPAPPLHVISGGGSGSRVVYPENPYRRAGFEAPGYARIDLVGEGDRERLTASLYQTSRSPLPQPSEGTLLSRWSVDRNGRVAEE